MRGVLPVREHSQRGEREHRPREAVSRPVPVPRPEHGVHVLDARDAPVFGAPPGDGRVLVGMVPARFSVWAGDGGEGFCVEELASGVVEELVDERVVR